MNKRWFLISIMIMTLYFPACTQGGSSISSSEGTADFRTSDSAEPDQTAESGTHSDTGGETVFDTEEYLKDYDNNNSISGVMKTVAATDDTVYFIKTLEDGYMYYYDRKTEQSGVLCADPSCLHRDEACGGYVGEGNPGLFLYDGKLYWVGRTQDPTGKSRFLRALLRCDSDGRNRETVLLLRREMTDQYQPQDFYLHRGYLYFVGEANTVDSAGEAAMLITVKGIALESGEEITILEEKQKGRVSRPKLFFMGTRIYYSYGKTEDESSTYHVMCYHMRTKNTETVFSGEIRDSWQPLFAEYSFWIDGETVYTVFRDQNTGEATRLKKLKDGRWEDAYVPEDRAWLMMTAGMLVQRDTQGNDGREMLSIRDLEGNLLYRELLELPEDFRGFSIAGGDRHELFMPIMGESGYNPKMYLIRADIKNQTPPEIIIE